MMIKPITKPPTPTSRPLARRAAQRPVVLIVAAEDVYPLLVTSRLGQDTQWVPLNAVLQAETMLQLYQPDCVLINETLFHTTGLDLIQTCACYQVPVLVLTEETDQHMEKRLRQFGALTCVPKRGLTAAALQAAIGSAVEKHLAWLPLPLPSVSGTSVLAQHFRTQARAPDLLIVDDDVNLVGALQRRLRPQGYEMRSAYAVDQAIESVKTSQPDLILLDIKLPVISGWWLAEWLQTSRETVDIPVIVLTGLGAPEVEAEAQAYGVFACLTKPVVTADLLHTIKDALSSHKKP